MISLYYKQVKEPELKLLEQFRLGCWIYVEDPTEAEINQLAEQFSLETGLLKDAIDPYEGSRLEIKNQVVYIFTRVPLQENELISTVPMMIGLANNFLITVSSKPLPFLNRFTHSEIEFYTTQKMKMLLQLFSEINADYSEVLVQINRRLRQMRVRLGKVSNRDIIRFIAFEEVINDFLAALIPTNTILNNLLSGKIIELHPNDKDLVEDLALSNAQLIELCKSNLKNLVNIRETYSTIMTNNLNRVIKFLTALTVLINIPVIISSLYGMNVKLPWAQSPAAFSFILGFTALISLVVLVIFARNRWL